VGKLIGKAVEVQADRRQETVMESFVYKEHRVHCSRLASGLWLGMIVKLGQKKAMTKNSLTLAVTRVPGEYDSEEEAIRVAKQYIDDEAGRPAAEAAD
jgi:hypothetical protein